MSTVSWGTVVAAILLFVSASVVHSPVLAGPIHDAAKAGDTAQVEALIAGGTNVDERDVAQRTALHWAADLGHLDVAKALVAKGADVNAKDFNDLTVLHVATIGKHEAIAKLIIDSGANVNATDTWSQGATPLDYAIRLGLPGIVDTLKSAGAKCGTSEVWSRNCKEAVGSE